MKTQEISLENLLNIIEEEGRIPEIYDGLAAVPPGTRMEAKRDPAFPWLRKKEREKLPARY